MSSTPLSKSNLHIQSLTMTDLTVGRHVTEFNLGWGIVERYVVQSPPCASYESRLHNGPADMVFLRNVDDGHHAYHDLFRMGVVANKDGTWNNLTFTIDSDDERALPEPDPALLIPLALQQG